MVNSEVNETFLLHFIILAQCKIKCSEKSVMWNKWEKMLKLAHDLKYIVDLTIIVVYYYFVVNYGGLFVICRG